MRLKLILATLTTTLTILGVQTANAWHAIDVQVTAVCDGTKGVYNLTATIQQSQEWPGAFVKSVTPSSLPGTTAGSIKAVVVIGWATSTETQTFTRYVSLNGKCAIVCEPTVVERIVYVDRPVEVVREVEKRVEVPVVKTVTKIVYKTRVVVKWKTRTVTKTVVKWRTKRIHDRCPPPIVCCVGKG